MDEAEIRKTEESFKGQEDMATIPSLLCARKPFGIRKAGGERQLYGMDQVAIAAKV